MQPRAAAAPPAPVTGTVVDKRGLPLPDQIVATGAAKTTSDGEGRFTFPAAPDRCDLVIASPDGALATVYQGVTRRDPIISFEGAPAREPKPKAEIAVTLVDTDAYLKAYADYSAAHPGFDADQPLPVASPEEPEPPPDIFKGRKRAFSGQD